MQILLFFSLLCGVQAAKKVSLSGIESLTFRKGQMSSGQRTLPVPQLKCTGGNALGLYEVGEMTCKNLGDHRTGELSWACTADLPAEVKLGSTDVQCEGWANAQDRENILDGSCGCEYTLYLTKDPEEDRHSVLPGSHDNSPFAQVFKAVFFMISGILVFRFINAWLTPAAARPPARRNRGLRGNHAGDQGDDDSDDDGRNDHGNGGEHRTSSHQGTAAGSWTPLAMAGIAGAGAGMLSSSSRGGQQRSAHRQDSSSGSVSSVAMDNTSVDNTSSVGASSGFGETRFR